MNEESLLKKKIGTLPIWLLELQGAKIIVPTAFEPDPNTCRDEYYYNAVSNVLYKKLISRNEKGKISATWTRA